MGHWIIRSYEQGSYNYIVYDFETKEITIALSKSFATVFTTVFKNKGLSKEIFKKAEDMGLQGLEWKKVQLELICL